MLQIPTGAALPGTAAVRAVPQGAGQSTVHQVHRRPAAPALAALPAQTHDAPRC